jgi:hypothetical protein
LNTATTPGSVPKKPFLTINTTATAPFPLSPETPLSVRYDLLKGKQLNEKVKDYLLKYKTAEPMALTPTRIETQKSARVASSAKVACSYPNSTSFQLFPFHSPGPEDLWSPVPVSFEKEDISPEKFRGKWHMRRKSPSQAEK